MARDVEKTLNEYGVAELNFEYTDDGHKTYASYEPFIYVPEQDTEGDASGEGKPVEGPRAARARQRELEEAMEQSGTAAQQEEAPRREEPSQQEQASGPDVAAGPDGSGDRDPEGTPEPARTDNTENSAAEEKSSKARRKGLRVFLIVLAVLIVAGAAGAGIWWKMQPVESTLGSALAARDLRIWYHVTSEDGMFTDESAVVSAWVFEDGRVTWYRAPEGMTLGDAAGTDQAKVYNALRKQNIITFKELSEKNRKAAESALDAASKVAAAKKKAAEAQEAYKKEEQSLSETYKGNIPEDVLTELKKKYEVKIPADPAVPAAEANKAIAFFDAFEDGSETPDSCSYRLYCRNRNGAPREWLAFNTQEYPGFAGSKWASAAVVSNYICLYDGLEVFPAGGHTVGGYRIGDEDGASATELLVTTCRKDAVFLLDTEASGKVSLNKGDETIRVEMNALAEEDYLRIADAADDAEAAESALPEIQDTARKTAADSYVLNSTEERGKEAANDGE